jgi:hypothetical protein
MPRLRVRAVPLLRLALRARRRAGRLPFPAAGAAGVEAGAVSPAAAGVAVR